VPTTYKAVLDHSPLPWAATIDRVQTFLDTNFEAIATPFVWDPEDNALNAWREQIEEQLIRFISECKARPLRNANKIVGTLRHIAKNPDQFLQGVGSYDPAAVNHLYLAYSTFSPDRKRELLEFEIGQGELPVQTIADAATLAIKRIEECLRRKAKKGGRPEDSILDRFAEMVAVLFKAAGGTPTATEGNKFWAFAARLRDFVLEDAKDAGSTLTIESVIRRAVKLK